MILKFIKNIYQKPVTNIIFSAERPKSFPPNSEKKANTPAHITLTYNVELKVQASEIRQENKKGKRLKKKQLP